jgi:hypothetical protein
MKLVRRDHDVYTVVYGLMYGIGVKRPWCCIDRVVHGLMYGISEKNSIHETIEHSVYTTSWSLLTNSIHETIDHSLYIQHHGVFTPIPDREKRPWCCKER